ncbi:hypothetical protein BCEN4_420003 [Burkholderia cenocepacia]|nr:hypothetical protein BCEN4_420003 [Burkholderia cenocepacia]
MASHMRIKRKKPLAPRPAILVYRNKYRRTYENTYPGSVPGAPLSLSESANQMSPMTLVLGSMVTTIPKPRPRAAVRTLFRGACHADRSA